VRKGSCFGYNNLVVDMLGMDMMRPMAPVIFDVTHALQRPGGRADSADGRGSQAAVLARAGVAVGIAGLFLEAHPDPASALCDGPSALPLANLEAFLGEVQAVDEAVKFRPRWTDCPARPMADSFFRIPPFRAIAPGPCWCPAAVTIWRWLNG
jgi:2-dehydro-3-deoxyphosphooctonate aldolase (KDO 8-P synthase)